MPSLTEFDTLSAAYLAVIAEESDAGDELLTELKAAFSGVRDYLLQCTPEQVTSAFVKLDNVIFDKFVTPHALYLSLQHCSIILYKHGGKLHNPLCKGECLGDTRIFMSDTIIELSYYLSKKGLLTDSLRKAASRIKRDTAYLSGASVSATRSRLLRFMSIHKLTNVRSWGLETGPTLFEQVKELRVESDTPTTGVEYEARVLIDELTLLLVDNDYMTPEYDAVFDQAELHLGLGQPEEVIDIINGMIWTNFNRGDPLYYDVEYLRGTLYEQGGKLHTTDCVGDVKSFLAVSTVAKFFHIIKSKGFMPDDIVNSLAVMCYLDNDEIVPKLTEICETHFPASDSRTDTIRAELIGLLQSSQS